MPWFVGKVVDGALRSDYSRPFVVDDVDIGVFFASQQRRRVFVVGGFGRGSDRYGGFVRCVQ